MKLKEKLPCFVCDLDGTLCDVSNRRQWVQCKPKNWNAWNAGVPYDKPNLPVLHTINALANSFDIVLVSGRGSEYRAETIAWLREHGVRFTSLYMRAEGDCRADDEIKAELADEVEETFKILGVFDDRQRVVQMWLQRGIFVFDVSQGKGNF